MIESCSEFKTSLTSIVMRSNKRIHVNDEILCRLLQDKECSDVSENVVVIVR